LKGENELILMPGIVYYPPGWGIDKRTKVPITPSSVIIILTGRFIINTKVDKPIKIHITIKEIILVCNGIDGVFLKLCMYLPNNLCRI
jgi:hypothetical protein